jgi:hypothetical protein
MNVDIGTEAAQFLFWEYINGIFVAVQDGLELKCRHEGSHKSSSWFFVRRASCLIIEHMEVTRAILSVLIVSK